MTCAQVCETKHSTITAAMSPYAVEITDRFFDVDCSGGNVTLQLPAVASSTGKKYDFHKTDASANRAIVLPQSGEFINGLPAKLLHLHRQAFGLRCATAEWEVNYEPSRLSPGYVDGLGVEWVSATQVRVLSGRCRSSDDTLNIILPASDTADITVGADRDFVPSGNEWVYVYVIADSLGANSPRAFLSSSSTNPVIPSGWDKARRVGVVRSAVALTILSFSESGDGLVRDYLYVQDELTTRVLTGGNAVVFTNLSLASFVPPGCRLAYLTCEYNVAANTSVADFRPTGSGLVGPTVNAISPGVNLTSAVGLRPGIMLMATLGLQTIDYKVSLATELLHVSVAGYRVSLAA